MKVTVLKDGHQFVVHVVDPKHDPFAELAAAQESTEAAEPVVEQNVVKDECKDTEGTDSHKKNVHVCAPN